MKNLGIAPNHLTFELLLSAHIDKPEALHANALFAEMLQHKLSPNTVIYNKLLAANARHPAYCDQIYEHMREAGCTPDVDTVRALVISQTHCTSNEVFLFP
jgi:pentatricopeptide repeat protein